MSVLLQRLAFVTGLIPWTPIADVKRSSLLAAELVISLSGLIIWSLWPLHVAVSVAWWLVSGSPLRWRRHLECLIEWQTYVAMRTFGRPYPRPQLGEPLAEQWPRVRGWYLLPEANAGGVPFEEDAATVAGRNYRARVFGVRVWVIGLVAGFVLLVIGMATNNFVVGVAGPLVAGGGMGLNGAVRLQHW